jgi:hypothetical protein
MNRKVITSLFIPGIAVAICLLASAAAHAQAPPGPIPGGQSQPPAQGSTSPKPQTAPAHPPRQPHDLAGSWKLNHDESDDPRKKMQEARDNRGGSGGGGRRGGGGVGFPGGGGGGRGGYGGRRGSDTDDDRQRMRQLFNPAETLAIMQKDAELDFTDDQGARQAYFTDGRKIEKSKDPKNTQAAAKWNDTRLVSEEKISNSRKLTRTFELSPEGDQLYVTLKLGNDRSDFPMSFHYVYDSVPQSQP